MTNALIWLLGAALAGAASDPQAAIPAEADSSGRICVAPIPADARALDAETGNIEGYSSYDFAFRIDDGQWHDLPSSEPQWGPTVDLAGKHLAAIREGNKVVESLWFTFQGRGGPVLCLSYTPWYQTWTFEPPLNRRWCACSK